MTKPKKQCAVCRWSKKEHPASREGEVCPTFVKPTRRELWARIEVAEERERGVRATLTGAAARAERAVDIATERAGQTHALAAEVGIRQKEIVTLHSRIHLLCTALKRISGGFSSPAELLRDIAQGAIDASERLRT